METLYIHLQFSKLALEGIKRQAIAVFKPERFQVWQTIGVSCYGFDKDLLTVEITQTQPFVVTHKAFDKNGLICEYEWWDIRLNEQRLGFNGIYNFAQLEGFDMAAGFTVPQFVEYFSKIHRLPVTGKVVTWKVATIDEAWYGLVRLTQPETGCYRNPVDSWWRATPLAEIAFPDFIVQGIPANWRRM